MNKRRHINEPIITSETSFLDFNLASILEQSLLDDVIKFHQSTTIIKRDSRINPYSIDMFNWFSNVEYTDVVPNMYLSEHALIDYEYIQKGSVRSFSKKEEFPFHTLSSVIKKSFGRSKDSTSKRHPSAGALYPVIPLVCILENYPKSDLTEGAYVYDSYRHSLKKIKQWDLYEFKELKSVLTSWTGSIYSNYFIAYAIDIKRAIAKYKKRGYRHALIEVGTMVQAFKDSLLEEGKNFGEFCFSGFDDNALTHLLGLNPRLCPVTLIQWFGKTLHREE